MMTMTTTTTTTTTSTDTEDTQEGLLPGDHDPKMAGKRSEVRLKTMVK